MASNFSLDLCPTNGWEREREREREREINGQEDNIEIPKYLNYYLKKKRRKAHFSPYIFKRFPF